MMADGGRSLSDDLDDPLEFVLRDSSQPAGESIHAFRGWRIGHGTGAVGPIYEIPECAVFLSSDGVVRVAVRDHLPEDGELGTGDEWLLIGVFDQASRSFGWIAEHFAGRENTGYRAAFKEAWNQAAGAVGWPLI